MGDLGGEDEMDLREGGGIMLLYKGIFREKGEWCID